MYLSFMSYTMYGGDPDHSLTPQIVTQIARENDLLELDMIQFELDTLGENALRAALTDNGVKLGCLIIGLPFYTAPEEIAPLMDVALKQAQRMGTEYLMVIPGGTDEANIQACAAMTRQQMLDRAVECYAAAVEMAKPYGVTVCFENTPQTFKPLASAEDCLHVLRRVPGLGFVFDTANFRVANTACDELAIYQQMKPYIVRFHIKDVILCDGLPGEICENGQYIRMVPTGEGVIPMKQLLQQLSRDGFDGALAIEYSAPPEANGLEHTRFLCTYCDFVRKALKEASE